MSTTANITNPPTSSHDADGAASDQTREERIAVLPAELLEEITKRQAAAVAAVKFPHHDPAWVPSTGTLSARIVEAPDHPYYEYLTDLTLEQKAALPARFHIPTFDDLGKPNAWLCAVCWDEGTVTGWPCATAQKYGAEVFGQSRGDTVRTRLENAVAEVAELRAELEKARSIAARLEQEDADLETGLGLNEAA